MRLPPRLVLAGCTTSIIGEIDWRCSLFRGVLGDPEKFIWGLKLRCFDPRKGQWEINDPAVAAPSRDVVTVPIRLQYFPIRASIGIDRKLQPLSRRIARDIKGPS